MRLLTVTLLAVALAVPAQAADGWRAFYGAKPTAQSVQTVRRGHNMTASEATGPHDTAEIAAGTVCLREILAAQTRHNIPNNLLLAIGLQEAGTTHRGKTTVWPFAVNAAGEGRLFDTEAEAQEFVRLRQSQGVNSIDVGCMQINLRWHPDAFADLDEGFDPQLNVDYSARFLKRLAVELGSWRAAAGAYHSRAPEFRDKYLARLDGNVARAQSRVAEIRERVAAAPPYRRRSAPSAHFGVVGWGAQLGGGGRGTLYSGGEVSPLLASVNR